MLSIKPVTTTTTKIRLTAAKIGVLLHDGSESFFSAAFPCGGYFEIEIHALSNGSTAMRLTDAEHENFDTKLKRQAENVIDVYLSAVSNYL